MSRLIHNRRLARRALSAPVASLGYAEFHIFDCEFASKLGILSRGLDWTDFASHHKTVATLLGSGLALGQKPRDKADSSLMCSFLTKPKQLIKFDLIVPISR